MLRWGVVLQTFFDLEKYRKLRRDIGELREGRIGLEVKERIKEFERMFEMGSREWFNELCFCLLTANSSAKLGLKIQGYMEEENGFLEFTKQELEEKLRFFGHRFSEARARYIVEARKYAENLKEIITGMEGAFEARNWLVKNVKGLGMKEASHFLRNVGFKDLAIIDKHVLNILIRYGLIEEKPRTLTRRRYLEIEGLLRSLASKMDLTLAELDLFLWSMETGEVLK